MKRAGIKGSLRLLSFTIQPLTQESLKVEKVDAMLGSYGAQPDPRRVSVVQDEFPSGMLARGVYNVRSRATDIDGEVYAGAYFDR